MNIILIVSKDFPALWKAPSPLPGISRCSLSSEEFPRKSAFPSQDFSALLCPGRLPLCPRILPRVRVLQARARRSPAQCAVCKRPYRRHHSRPWSARFERGPYTRYTLSRATHDSVTGDRAGGPHGDSDM